MRISVILAFAFVACTPQGDVGIPSTGFEDTFDRSTLGDHWHNTGGPWRIQNEQLRVRGARNKPLWLRRRLPRDVRIEFDARSESPEGDIKVEIFGDGASKATQASYTATSYVIIFGGWNNSKNLIARLDEHGDDAVQGPARQVEPGRTYRFRIERQGSTITAWVDDEVLATMNDPAPLYGRGHEYFAFNNWASELYFDNLKITPL